MHGKYRIKATKYCKRDEVVIEYVAPTHPAKDSQIWYEGKRYIVACIHHRLKTIDKGTSQEYTTLDYVELEVMF